MAPFSAILTPAFFTLLTALLCGAITLRLLTVYRSLGQPTRDRIRKGDPTHLLIVLGSGGHTQEMLYLLPALKSYKWTHRTWVLSSGDKLSADRAMQAEREIQERERNLEVWRGVGDIDEEVPKDDGWPMVPHNGEGTFDVVTVPRARKIYQSLFSTPFSALWCLIGCFNVLLFSRTPLDPQYPDDKSPPTTPDLPDIIFCNGPATAVIMVLAAWILRFFDVRGAQSRDKLKTVYVESFARVTTLSLSGRLLLPVVDWFYVQWPQLDGKGGRAQYKGCLVLE